MKRRPVLAAKGAAYRQICYCTVPSLAHRLQVLRQARILVLDEATSALDSVTERAIQEAVADMRARCTTLIVAHRLSTVADADQIIVMELGVIRERGSHSDLLAQVRSLSLFPEHSLSLSLPCSPALSCKGHGCHSNSPLCTT